MRKVNFRMIGMSEYSQSRNHETPFLDKETKEAHDDRTWRNRLHVMPKTNQVFVPPMALKMCLDACAKFLGKQIPGKGKNQYTKHFEAGTLCLKPILLFHHGSDKPILGKEVPGERLYVNSDGVRGSGKRVWRTYPRIDNWYGDAEMIILDDTITESVFEEHLEQAGQFIGIGRFRPRNGGYYGRFIFEDLTVEDIDPRALAPKREEVLS